MLESWTWDFKLVRQVSTPPQELEFTFLGCNHYWLCSLELGTHTLWATVPSANKRLIRASFLSPGLHWVCLGKSLVNGVIISFPPELSGQSQQPRLELSQESAPTRPRWWEKHHPKSQKQNSFLSRREKGRTAVPMAVNLHQVQVQSEVYPDTYYLFTRFILKLLFESRSHFLQARPRQPLAIVCILLVKLSSAAPEQIDTLGNIELPTCLYEYDTWKAKAREGFVGSLKKEATGQY